MIDTKKLLSELNEKQREAVTKTEGAVLVLAGAGSGKTRALTYRVAYLIKEKKISPRNILAVTFTNKAAGEMQERIKELLNLHPTTSPYSTSMPHVGTFHSICSKILRQEIEKVGYDKNFVIYDDKDQLALIKKIMKEVDVPEDRIKPKAVLGTISKAKSNLISAGEFVKEASSYYEELVGEIYVKYQNKLRETNAVDFDDIIMITVQLFQKNPDILEKYQDIFKYIMVDEYQDTNHTQYILLKILARKYGNICVVGFYWSN
jgi:DNA helicase-2/ATP-dependent DNA helicase PcrA